MTDLSLGLQEAIWTTLRAAVTLATVYQHPGEDAEMPYVVIGDDTVENIGGKGDRLESHTVSIATVFEGPSKKLVRQIQEQVRSALDGVPITAADCFFSAPTFENAEESLLEDGETYVGQQRFYVIAQPAG